MNCLELVLTTPWSLYDVFVIEEKHGFNKQVCKIKQILEYQQSLPSFLFQTFTIFIKDQLTKFIVVNVISVPIIAISILLIKWAGDSFFIYLWLFASACMFVSHFTYFVILVNFA